MTLYEKTLTLIDAEVEAEGDFSAVVAAFGGEPDRHGDVIHKGAFVASLDAWRASGKLIPVVWSHEVENPSMVIGSASPAKSHETAEGLVLAGKLNVYDSPVASHVRDLLKDGSISGWSFSYKIVRSRPRRGGLDLLELDIGEAGPCVMPANVNTRTVSVKGAEPGRREPRRPSHVELEGRLRATGILARIAPDTLAEDERDVLLDALRRRRNGHETEDAGKAASPVGTKAGAVTIARFEVA
jgi:HK97 family phage prohead protease